MVTEQKAQANGTGAEPRRPPSPPYVSYLTFRNLITWLEAEGIPLRFDRSFWSRKFSGSTGAQLMTGLRFLHLLEGDQPTPNLEELVRARGEDRKRLLRNILQNTYASVKFDDLPRATAGMLREWFKVYGIDGHTLRKAESFFINALKDADVPLSNILRKMARNRSIRSNVADARERKAAKVELTGGLQSVRGGKQGIPRSRNLPATEAPQANETTVNLESGGIIKLILEVDLFQLSAGDREFVLGLVDLVQKYQQRLGSEHKADGGVPS